MKFIQSLKTATGIADKNGWLSPEFHLMSWALSCLQFIKLHGTLELYTNSYGKEILIDMLGLPYSKVNVVLNNESCCHPQLWAYSKLQVYSLQKEPFLHIDGDVFIWEKLSDSFLSAPVCTQNLEFDLDDYYKMLLFPQVSRKRTLWPHAKYKVCNI